ncbi:MAG: phosphoribosylformylglycinamidine cyclo-ligase [Deltaproteobacteria bacterium]|nr:phosphoribosylformylglycinamidine cyclo-ligase [Deltaproteobacteria bacterium]
MDQYREAGVNIEAGDAFVESIKAIVAKTHTPAVLSNIGGFAAHVAFDPRAYAAPVLVSSTDGVGTKVRVAIDAKKLDTIGIDLVAMCANDLACSGATPLFFLDYFATGRLRPRHHTEIIRGIANACAEIRCALVGGETAEMPGIYQRDDFDLAGFIVGVVDRATLIDGRTIVPGDRLLGVASTGFHSNGYSHLRTVISNAGLSRHAQFPRTDRSVLEQLLAPTALYSPLILALGSRFALHGIAHITGGGLTGNIPRILPAGCAAEIDWSHWELPPPFAFVQEAASMPDDELRRVYNCGVGLVIVCTATEVKAMLAEIAAHGHTARDIGTVVAATDGDPIRYV